MNLSLHGRIGNLPAARVELVIDEAPPHRIRLRGTVFERSFYGPKLRLDSEVSIVPGESSWRSPTRSRTSGPRRRIPVDLPRELRSALLGEGSRLVVPARTLAPMNAKAETAIDGFETYRGPTEGFVEEVYLIEPYAAEDGTTMALLVAPGGELATSVRWRVEELPYFTQWKNTAAKADGYVTGMEPGTGFPFNRKVERGPRPRPEAGARRVALLHPRDYAFYTGSQVGLAEAWVRSIQADRPTERSGVPD